ncbi:hypothetical protein L6452_04341 [Arctium lappa]|uniref:Uncharacterized protein n=1 Tax=Arctium lappa TaxID=4217 RepID=A0ACB9FP55_ARCLA|nr:hypothetical protein L6452_04341 [Arctium lappa]
MMSSICLSFAIFKVEYTYVDGHFCMCLVLYIKRMRPTGSWYGIILFWGELRESRSESVTDNDNGGSLLDISRKIKVAGIGLVGSLWVQIQGHVHPLWFQNPNLYAFLLSKLVVAYG